MKLDGLTKDVRRDPVTWNINEPAVLAAAPNSQIDGEKYAHIQW